MSGVLYGSVEDDLRTLNHFVSRMRVFDIFHELFEQNNSSEETKSDDESSGTKRYQTLVAATTRLEESVRTPCHSML